MALKTLFPHLKEYLNGFGFLGVVVCSPRCPEYVIWKQDVDWAI